MRVSSAHRVGSGAMDPGVDGKRCGVDRMIALDHLAFVITSDQVGYLDLAEVNTKRVHPKGIGMVGVTRGNVAGDAFVKAKF